MSRRSDFAGGQGGLSAKKLEDGCLAFSWSGKHLDSPSWTYDGNLLFFVLTERAVFYFCWQNFEIYFFVVLAMKLFVKVNMVFKSCRWYLRGLIRLDVNRRIMFHLWNDLFPSGETDIGFVFISGTKRYEMYP